MVDELKQFVCKTIDSKANDLKYISSKIWENPELGFKEFQAHGLLTAFLQKEGFSVAKKTPLETSFIARYGNPDGLKVGICCEYDALPGIGHACGHNLIAEASVGAALGIKEFLSFKPEIKAEIVLFGTPAEEGGGGKILMIDKGCFDGIDFCMMSHPLANEVPEPECLAMTEMTIVFNGKPSHAAAAPWEGINALDAAVACYNSISMLRQQITPRARVHVIITDGGKKANIIPERSELTVVIRDLTSEGAKRLRSRLINCAKGAAVGTGCSVDILYEDFQFYSSLNTNRTLIKLYVENGTRLGTNFKTLPQHKERGSTDMGNVSQKIPSIHPFFKINANSSNHSKEFTKSVILDENQLPTLNSAKSMAMTAIDVLYYPELLQKIKQDFADGNTETDR